MSVVTFGELEPASVENPPGAELTFVDALAGVVLAPMEVELASAKSLVGVVLLSIEICVGVGIGLAELRVERTLTEITVEPSSAIVLEGVEPASAEKLVEVELASAETLVAVELSDELWGKQGSAETLAGVELASVKNPEVV